MIQLNYLEKLLGDVDVEWLPLGNLAEIGTGKSNRQDETEDGEYPFYVRSKNILRSNTFQFDEKAIVVPGEGGIGDIFHFVEGKYALHQRAYRVKATSDVLDTKFLYHFMSSKFKQYILMKSVGATSISIRKPMLEGFQIPIPCPDNPKKSLAIQAEIVRILDAFTAMTAELTAELNMRKKQYNYYRDQLLSFEDGEVEWKTLGEVALDFGRGKSKHRPRNDPSLYGGDIPFIQTGDIRNAAHTIQEYRQTYSELGLKQSKLWPKGTLCITIAANIAETSILGFDACFPDSVIGFVANPEETSSSYVEYLLSSIKTQLEEKGQGSAQSNINLGTFQNLKLPFPPITEQERIVALLDKFELLTNSITEGLPREIELRQKQYEYYRDLLLSFPKSHSDEAA
ncbi:restriction endonuclease subunit S [Vibrio cholerae]|jgi:type I restriction enzyme S subunit|uniref:restriction endonuclease subunit S n=1 Tax=unclassified Vibrio TaxID=2614977 RepID=UPI001B819B7B|nr:MULTISPECIES: restriction endonuclease subunit S [unclassified Vibrio]GIC18435.1 restriction endonuclease subunit S [Vibrio cholerae]HBC3858366.1 restriction endonuclease subunit S [Vibrio parahaemolyticus]MDW1517693.1 restriction endonuclease subunit S [Vibrio sp. Vb5035]MDW1547868.1 restriction endonuclease subunit S [Vibrio sp. Vb5034]GIC32217.1 restriction endonuclease subunit S [Vibrio cholerae]